MDKIRVLAFVLFSALATAASSVAADSVPLIPRADLFGNPQKIYSDISPDAKWVSWLAPLNGVMNLWVAPTAHLDAARPITQDTGRGLGTSAGSHAWAYDDRHLVYLLDGNGSGNTRLYSADVDGRTTRDLTPFDNMRATIVALSPKTPDEILISLNKSDVKYADLYRVNLRTGALTLVIKNPDFISFLADDDLNPRVAIKRESSGDETVLRPRDGVWIPWIAIPYGDTRTTSLLSIESGGKGVFVLDSRDRNTAALARIDLETGKETVLAEEPHADIRDVILDQETHRPMAYSIMVERMEHRALVPKLQADLDFLAARNIGDWVVNSRSRDDRYWKLTSFTATNMLAYLYDRKAKSLTKLYDPRPDLVPAPLVDMRPLTIKSRDGLDLVSYLSLPKGSDTNRAGIPDNPLPLVLVIHGGPHNRDSIGYNAIHQWLANRGYAALSVNMRGSTGFGKAFVNGSIGEWGRKLDDDLLDAVAWAIQNKIADRARVAIMGGSYGGYATLAGLTRDPDTYACGVDLFGPSDLVSFESTQASYLTTGVMLRKEFGDPNTEEGRAVMKAQSPLFSADRIKKPLIVAQGANDPSVNRAQSDRMVAAVKETGIPVTYLLYPDEGHGFQRAANNLSLYAIEEQFLAKCLGGRTEPITNADLKGSSVQILEGADQIDGLVTAMAQAAPPSTTVR